MAINPVDRTQREDYLFDSGLDGAIPDGQPELREAAGLLHALVYQSNRTAPDILKADVNGAWRSVSSLYRDCEDKIRIICKHGDKAAFLAMGVLDQAFREILPLLILPLESVLDGSSPMADQARRLREILDGDPYRERWEKDVGTYRALVSQLGLSPDGIDYSDLAALSDPILDALTFYPRRPGIDPIRRFRLGPPSDPSLPVSFSRHVPVFRSESDLVLSVHGCEKDNAVMFAGLELTYGDTEDAFGAWYSGRDNERMINTMRNCGMSKEEYLSAVDPWSRRIYLCVKAGGDIYLVHMPYARGSYSGPEFSDETKYNYGRRAGYAPYQVFYDEPPAAPEDTDFLALPRPAWSLSNLMDGEQKAWLPMFLNETVEYFFKNGPADAVDAWLPGCRILSSPSGVPLYEPPRPALVPVRNLPDEARLRLDVPDPEDLFDEPFMKALIRAFGVKAADVAAHGAEILSGETLKNIDFPKRVRSTALRLLSERIEIALRDVDAAKAQIQAAMLDGNAVVGRILGGACDSFTDLIVSGAAGKDGRPERTSIEDTRPRGHLYVLWRDPKTSGAPPVLYQVRPHGAKDYAALLGVPVDGLAMPLRLYTELDLFWSRYQNTLPRSMSWNETVRPKPLLSVNLCMSKTEYKKLQKAKAGPEKNG